MTETNANTCVICDKPIEGQTFFNLQAQGDCCLECRDEPVLPPPSEIKRVHLTVWEITIASCPHCHHISEKMSSEYGEDEYKACESIATKTVRDGKTYYRCELCQKFFRL